MLQGLVSSSHGLALSVNSSDYNQSQANYYMYNTYYRNFVYYLSFYNLSESDYSAISQGLSNSAIDLHMIVNESQVYDINYQLFLNYSAEGDTVNAALCAAKLQGSYENLSRSIRNVKANLSTAVTITDASFVITDNETVEELNQSIDLFNRYYSRIYENQKLIEELYGGGNLTLASSDTETTIDRPVTLTSSLTSRDNAPIASGKIQLYANDRLSGTGTTDSNGTCTIVYSVPPESKSRITFYAKYLPDDTGKLPTTSNEVELRVRPENTTLSLGAAPVNVTFGDAVNVSGFLISPDGAGVPGRDIGIYIYDSRVGHALTGSDGFYRYNLVISPDTPGGLCLLHAAYGASPAGDDIFLSSSSNSSEISVRTQGSVLTLNSPGSELVSGEPAGFSGSLLAENGKPVRGEAVSIYAGEQLLGTAVTGSSGLYEKNITIPFGMASGTYPLYSRYSQESGRALTGSDSNTLSVYINSSPLVITAVSSPTILFAGDILYVNGSVSTISGKAVPNKSLLVNLSNVSVGEVATDLNGSYTFARTTNYTDSFGVYSLDVVLPGSDLSTGLTTPAGQVLLVPYDREPVVVGVILIALALLGVVLFLSTGGFRRIRARREVSAVAAPVPEEQAVQPAIVEAKPAEPPVMPEPKKEFNLEEALEAAQEYLSSGDLKSAVTLVYLLSRQMVAARGLAIQDSDTHREFYRTVTLKYPLLQTPLRFIVDTYEKANYSTVPVTGEEAATAVNGLREAHLSLTASNPKDQEPES